MKKKTVEFSKKLLILDYLIMIVLFICTIAYPEVELVTIEVAWIAQLGILSTAYYWKAKTENGTKVPVNVIKSLPKDMREELDLTQVIISIIQSDN